MPTTNRKYPNDLGLASPNTPHTHINALANAIDADVAALHADTGWTAWTKANGLAELYSAAASTAVFYRRSGGVVRVRGFVTRTSGAMNANVDALLGTLPVLPDAPVAMHHGAVRLVSGSGTPLSPDCDVILSTNGNVTARPCTRNVTGVHLNFDYYPRPA